MQLIKYNKYFPLHVWISSLLLAPLFLLLIGMVEPELRITSNWVGFALIMILTGFYLSIPTFIISLFTFFVIVGKVKSAIVKLLLTTIGISGILITYHLLPTNSLLNPGTHTIYYFIANSLSIITSVLYIKLILKMT